MFGYSKENNRYVLHDGERTVMTTSGDCVALAYSVYLYGDGTTQGTLHKHGDPEHVKKWYDNAVASYKNAGFHEMAASLFYLEGPLEVGELNRCLSTTGYVAVLHYAKQCEIQQPSGH